MTQTYSIEAAKANFVAILHRAQHGDEVLITENEKPIVKLVPADEDELYRQQVRALRGFAKGIDTEVYREREDRV